MWSEKSWSNLLGEAALVRAMSPGAGMEVKTMNIRGGVSRNTLHDQAAVTYPQGLGLFINSTLPLLMGLGLLHCCPAQFLVKTKVI